MSLHAATDVQRDALLPVNRRYKLDELMDACREYAEKAGRRVSFEWALIAGQNDRPEEAARLGALLQGLPCHVNLIPLNPTPGSKWTASDPKDERAFVRALEAGGIAVTVRDTRGREIDGACGQLAAASG